MTPEEETFITLQEPAPIIDESGTKRWFNENGQLHRDNDLPAVIYRDGSMDWYKNGIRHRKNGLAIIHTIGSGEYWEKGKRIE